MGLNPLGKTELEGGRRGAYRLKNNLRLSADPSGSVTNSFYSN
jgi:hypothetical protein